MKNQLVPVEIDVVAFNMLVIYGQSRRRVFEHTRVTATWRQLAGTARNGIILIEFEDLVRGYRSQVCNLSIRPRDKHLIECIDVTQTKVESRIDGRLKPPDGNLFQVKHTVSRLQGDRGTDRMSIGRLSLENDFQEVVIRVQSL